MFHRGACEGFVIINTKGEARIIKMPTMRIKGYSKNHPERPIEYIISKGTEPIK